MAGWCKRARVKAQERCWFRWRRERTGSRLFLCVRGIVRWGRGFRWWLLFLCWYRCGKLGGVFRFACSIGIFPAVRAGRPHDSRRDGGATTSLRRGEGGCFFFFFFNLRIFAGGGGGPSPRQPPGRRRYDFVTTALY